jgi:hypothetical protein
MIQDINKVIVHARCGRVKQPSCSSLGVGHEVTFGGVDQLALPNHRLQLSLKRRYSVCRLPLFPAFDRPFRNDCGSLAVYLFGRIEMVVQNDMSLDCIDHRIPLIVQSRKTCIGCGVDLATSFKFVKQSMSGGGVCLPMLMRIEIQDIAEGLEGRRW